jgi:Spy/CpxP family protein refolding chaperone
MNARLIFLISFFTAFAAGVTVGLVWSKPLPQGGKAPHKEGAKDGPSGREGGPRDPMAELRLTPDQNEKVKEFWTEAMKKSNWPMQRERREAARKERDDGLRALLTDEQKEKQDELNRAYQAKLDELDAISKRAREEAFEKTNAILSDAQKKTYEEMRKRRWDDKGRPRFGPPEGGPGAGGPPPPPKESEFGPARDAGGPKAKK